jgi:hypothetical protein
MPRPPDWTGVFCFREEKTMGSYTRDARTTNANTVCQKCGLEAHPQMMNAIFYQGDGSCPSWFIVGWEHLKCKEAGTCETCQHFSGNVCKDESSVWANHRPRANGCRCWAKHDRLKTYADFTGRAFVMTLAHYSDAVTASCSIAGAVEPLCAKGANREQAASLLTERLAKLRHRLPIHEIDLDRRHQNCPIQ